MVDQCNRILEVNNTKTVIDAAPAVMTELSVVYNPSHHERGAEDKDYYAKIARRTDQEGKLLDYPMIVFDRTHDAGAVTQYESAMRFGLTEDLEHQLIVGATADDEEYLKLATAIVSNLTEQISPDIARELETKRDRIWKTLGGVGTSAANMLANVGKNGRELTEHRSWFEDEHKNNPLLTRNQVRRRRAGVVLAGSLFWAHVPFTTVHADAGPVPMPQPVELVVDIINEPDHRAQGHDAAEGAAVVDISNPVVNPPLIPDYDTSRVPDATVASGYTSSYREESRPGMYDVSFTLNATIDGETRERFDLSEDENAFYKGTRYTTSEECVPIAEGLYTQDRTTVFTQTPGIEEAVEVRVTDQDSAEICALTDAEIEGSVFFHLGEAQK